MMMPTPFETEDHFQGLLLALSYPSSPRQRLQAIHNFLASLGGQFQTAEPYVLDIAQRLPDIVQQLQPEGVSPEELRSTLQSIQDLVFSLPVLHSVRGIDESIELLKLDLASQFVYVGELEQAASLFGDKPLLLSVPSQPVPAPVELLERGLVVAREQKHPVAVRFAEFLRSWKERNRTMPGRTVFPAVEKSRAATGQRPAGRLRGMSIELFGRVNGEKDDIRADVAVLQEEERDFFGPAVTAVRTNITQSHPQLEKRFFSGRIQFDDLSAMHDGTSANLAVAALLYCEILRFSNQRTMFRLSPRAAFTGAVKENGEVLPVEMTTLSAKVEAAFFSWLDFLVVPRTQAAETEALVRNLQRAFPRRALTIISVENLRDVFYDRRLSTLLVVGAARHLGMVVWRKKPLVLTVTVVAILLLVIAKLWYGPVDKKPTYVEAVGQELVVRNSRGEKLDAVPVRRITAEAIQRQGGSWLSMVELYDVNGDGNDEVIWAESTSEREKETSSVSCKVVGADTVLWTYEVNKRFSFPNNRDAETGGYGITDLVVGDINDDHKPYVFFAAQNAMFCSIIGKLDARTGKEVDYYLNFGHIIDLLLVDLRKDGKPFLVGCGVNNAFAQGCLVVLDPSRMSGHSPIRGEYRVDSLPPARELYYLLAPRSTLAALYSESAHNNALSVESENGGGILWNVRDIYVKQGDGFLSGVVRFHMDSHLRFQQAGSNNEFDFYLRKALDEQRIPPISQAEYLRQLGENVLYWDGDGWQKKAVMNRRYLEVARKKE